MTDPIITPTVGRIVHYFLHDTTDSALARFNTQGNNRPDPLAAMVVGVHGIGHVNLVVYDANGEAHRREVVPLVQGESAAYPADRAHCEWMPYQKGQAAKTEALERVVQGTASGSATLGFPSLEQTIKSAASKAPRVTPADIEAAIESEHYFTAGDGFAGAAALTIETGGTIEPPAPLDLLTFCVLVLKNGFSVTGESACASPENFNAEIGRRVARENAVNKVWPLLGFRLRDQLASPT